MCACAGIYEPEPIVDASEVWQRTMDRMSSISPAGREVAPPPRRLRETISKITAARSSTKDHPGDARDLHRPTVEAAETRFQEFADAWEQTRPATIQAWRSVRVEFVPFLEFPPELRKVVYTTNAIECLNARFRRAVRHRGHFPYEQSALKVLYLVATRQRKSRQGMTGKLNSWKTILNTLHVHYGDRIAANSII